ncbi:MAG TPA: hypothetical protein VGM15_03155 [Burkholderiaceae bacterium]|jgi:hypothetical protein
MIDINRRTAEIERAYRIMFNKPVMSTYYLGAVEPYKNLLILWCSGMRLACMVEDHTDRRAVATALRAMRATARGFR